MLIRNLKRNRDETSARVRFDPAFTERRPTSKKLQNKDKNFFIP